MTAGYLALVGVFVGMVLICFAFAISELARPRDPGPLPIDVGRDIQDRHFARTLRLTPAPLRALMAPESVDDAGDATVRLPDGSEVPDKSGAVVVHGDGTVREDATVGSIVCNGVATLGPRAIVSDHAEGYTALVLSDGALVGGRATSGEVIWLASGARVRHAGAPEIRTAGPSLDEEAPAAAWPPPLDLDLARLLADGVPVDVAARTVCSLWGEAVDVGEGLRRYETQAMRPTAALDLAATLNPTWLGGARGWYLGAGTARVRGDLELPPDAIVPFSLIVEGSLSGGEGSRIYGSVHAGGDVWLGASCRVDGSVTARGMVLLEEGCVVRECLSAGADARIAAGCRIGSERNGGLTAAGRVELGAGVVVRNKLYAESGASAG